MYRRDQSNLNSKLQNDWCQKGLRINKDMPEGLKSYKNN